jgi:hypothetical protein
MCWTKDTSLTALTRLRYDTRLVKYDIDVTCLHENVNVNNAIQHGIVTTLSRLYCTQFYHNFSRTIMPNFDGQKTMITLGEWDPEISITHSNKCTPFSSIMQCYTRK